MEVVQLEVFYMEESFEWWYTHARADTHTCMRTRVRWFACFERALRTVLKVKRFCGDFNTPRRMVVVTRVSSPTAKEPMVTNRANAIRSRKEIYISKKRPMFCPDVVLLYIWHEHVKVMLSYWHLHSSLLKSLPTSIFPVHSLFFGKDQTL